MALLENGADVDAVYPLHLALSSGNYDAAKILVWNGANIFVNHKGKTALQAAIDLLSSSVDFNPILEVIYAMLNRAPPEVNLTDELRLLQLTTRRFEERLALIKDLASSLDVMVLPVLPCGSGALANGVIICSACHRVKSVYCFFPRIRISCV